MTETKNIAIQKPELTEAEILEIQGQVTEKLNSYYAMGQYDERVKTDIYHFPFLYLGDEFAPAFAGQDEEEMFEVSKKRFEMLAKAEPDLDHSIYSINSITILNKLSVIVTGNNHSFRKDGSLILDEGVIYILSNIEEKGWRITAMTSIPVNTSLGLTKNSTSVM
ncbi:hypothetical protein [Ruegeria sp. ANG-R]|uniref:hypothetical protein n=1 Tax=Ruegeria sp. ANG-R TaxID=1577903 RepID=UPI00126A725C|nr:hypothetical protein [Ruegeria sp. ANG-R]